VILFTISLPAVVSYWIGIFLFCSLSFIFLTRTTLFLLLFWVFFSYMTSRSRGWSDFRTGRTKVFMWREKNKTAIGGYIYIIYAAAGLSRELVYRGRELDSLVVLSVKFFVFSSVLKVHPSIYHFPPLLRRPNSYIIRGEKKKKKGV
jgi:hypothetical protein